MARYDSSRFVLTIWATVFIVKKWMQYLDGMLNMESTGIQQEIIEFVVNSAQKWLKPNRVLFFGSRAKGTHTKVSDYDFAVDPSPDCLDKWAYFWNEVDEYAPTLCKIDLVNLRENLREEFRLEIERSGIVVWSQKYDG